MIITKINGVAMTELGAKHDQGKPRYDLLPAVAIDELAKVLTFGAEKYAANSWQEVDNGLERFRAALLRHTFAIQRGELYDKESGLLHASHAQCCAAIIVELQKKAEIMVIHTKHFHQVSDPKLKCTCGHELCNEPSVNQETLDRLQIVREALGYGLRVTSGGRCIYHPNEIHRTTPADHQKLQAVDIACAGGAQRGALVKAGIQTGFNAIGVAKTFVHLGHRPELGDQIVMWTY